MVVSFQDMLVKTTPVTNEHIWEKTIDKAIQEQFTYENRKVHIVLANADVELSTYTISKLQRMYKDAGWDITFQLPTVDQREGLIYGYIKLQQGVTYR